jgi:hypothetical protein
MAPISPEVQEILDRYYKQPDSIEIAREVRRHMLIGETSPESYEILREVQRIGQPAVRKLIKAVNERRPGYIFELTSSHWTR